jgi:hypothetical protein
VCNQLRRDLICPTCQVVLQPYIIQDMTQSISQNDIQDMNQDNFQDNIQDDIQDMIQNVDYIEDEFNNILSENTDEFYREYYDINKTQIIFEVPKVNGKWEGIATTYYQNGSIMRVVNYVNDKKDGFYKEYNKNGNLHHIQYYVNGLRHGFCKHFQGSLYDNSIYINDQLYEHSNAFQETLNSIRTKIVS